MNTCDGPAPGAGTSRGIPGAGNGVADQRAVASRDGRAAARFNMHGD